MRRVVVIPSYNPDYRLIKLINKLSNYDIDIIVVNDGSENSKVFNDIKDKVIYLKHSINKGKGSALKTAYRYIKDKYDTYSVVTMDCDGQHKPDDAFLIFDILDKNKNLLVLGKRLDNNNVPIINKIGHFLTRIIFRLISGKNIYDTQTGLRGFTYLNMDYMLQIKGQRFEYEMNVLLNLKDIKVKEVIIDTIYFKKHKSTFKVFKDSFMVYKEIFKYFISSISSAILDYTLFIFFSTILNNIVISNILSRTLSCIYNYNINKNIVFKTKKQSLISYLSLVIIILVLNTIIISILSIYINKFIAKLLADILLFILSYIISKYVIFKNK